MESESGIVIVGGGLSGALVAAQLLRQGYKAQLTIVEPRHDVGKGLAYSTQMDEHLLNVPAGKMSAFPDKPAHFIDWLSTQAYPLKNPGEFVPRKIFGQYLKDLLRTEIDHSSAGGLFQQISAEVTAVTSHASSVEVLLSGGRSLSASKIVLALGNPASSPLVDTEISEADRLLQPSPWLGDALQLRFPEERILLMGSGLTAVDSMLTLLGQRETSQVYMVSRRGFLPQIHSSCRPAPVLSTISAAGSLSAVLGELRECIETLMRMGFCWRVAIDALRPVSSQIWSSLSLADRRRFFRHVKPYWEPHRHRMAPAIGEKIQTHRASGRLCVIAGRIRKLTCANNSIEAHISSGGSNQLKLKVDRVIDCTGVHENYNDSRRPLIRKLIASGLASANDLGLGFRTDGNGALIDSQGNVSTRLFTLGPPRRGDLFETTAVPEIRCQAESLASHLIQT